MILWPWVVRLKSAVLENKRMTLKKPINHDREVSLSPGLESTLKRYAAPLGAKFRAGACRHWVISSK